MWAKEQKLVYGHVVCQSFGDRSLLGEQIFILLGLKQKFILLGEQIHILLSEQLFIVLGEQIYIFLVSTYQFYLMSKYFFLSEKIFIYSVSKK